MEVAERQQGLVVCIDRQPPSPPGMLRLSLCASAPLPLVPVAQHLQVVVALVGMWFFAEPTTPINLLSIDMGLLAGLMFVFAKSSPTNRREVRERRDDSSGGIGASSTSGGPPGAQGSGWLSPTSSGLVKLEDGSALQGQGLGQAQGDGRTR